MIALRLLGWLWALPVTVLGLLVVPFTSPRAVRFRWLGWHGTRAILEFDVGRWFDGYAAFTFGCVQGYRVTLAAHERWHIRKHEDVHTLQGFILGPLNPLAYGLCSVVSRLRGRGWYHNALEDWAYNWGAR